MANNQIGFRLEPAIKQKLEAKAASESRTLSSLLNYLVKQYLSKDVNHSKTQSFKKIKGVNQEVQS